MYIRRALIFYTLPFVIAIQQGEKIVRVEVDLGANLTLKCPISNAHDVGWVWESKNRTHEILENGSLFLGNVSRNDGGIYSCYRQNVVASEDMTHINVSLRTPPPALVDVTIHPSTIIALILWKVNGTGGYPIANFTARYRLASNRSADWIPISPNHITPNSRQIDVYKLKPNTTYEFQVWATNQLGKGVVTTINGTTLHEYTEEELARRMLAGAETFDTRLWAVAVGIVMGTLILLGLGTCFLLYQECRMPSVVEEQEIIELVPNIILNPGFDGNNSLQQMNEPPDENSNNETPLRLNNNTVVHPRNV